MGAKSFVMLFAKQNKIKHAFQSLSTATGNKIYSSWNRIRISLCLQILSTFEPLSVCSCQKSRKSASVIRQSAHLCQAAMLFNQVHIYIIYCAWFYNGWSTWAWVQYCIGKMWIKVRVIQIPCYACNTHKRLFIQLLPMYLNKNQSSRLLTFGVRCSLNLI